MYRQIRNAAAVIMLLALGLSANAEMRVATDDAMKAATKKTPPDYPMVAKQLKIIGKVAVDVTIDADGNVETVQIISGNAMLTASVVSAVKKWKFAPFKLDEKPVRAIAALEFNFRM